MYVSRWQLALAMALTIIATCAVMAISARASACDAGKRMAEDGSCVSSSFYDRVDYEPVLIRKVIYATATVREENGSYSQWSYIPNQGWVANQSR